MVAELSSLDEIALYSRAGCSETPESPPCPRSSLHKSRKFLRSLRIRILGIRNVPQLEHELRIGKGRSCDDNDGTPESKMPTRFIFESTHPPLFSSVFEKPEVPPFLLPLFRCLPMETMQPWRNTVSVLHSPFLNKSFVFFSTKRIFLFTDMRKGEEEKSFGVERFFGMILYETETKQKGTAPFGSKLGNADTPHGMHYHRCQGRRRYLFKGRPPLRNSAPFSAFRWRRDAPGIVGRDLEMPAPVGGFVGGKGSIGIPQQFLDSPELVRVEPFGKGGADVLAVPDEKEAVDVSWLNSPWPF